MTWGHIRFRIHPLCLLVLAASLYGGFLSATLVLFAVVIAHELGHVMAARAYGYHIESIEILPFGGVARLRASTMGWNARHETVIAIWGPMVNVFLVLLTVLLHWTGMISENSSSSFVTLNLTLLFFNLLPGLPLDGGRIARAGLALSMGFEQATRVVTRMSFILSVLLMVVGVLSLYLGYADAGLLALGVFLLYSAYTLAKQSRYDTLRFLDAKRRERPTDVQPLRSLVVQENMRIGDVVARFSPGAYHLVYVQETSTGHTAPCVIEERELLGAVFERSMWSEPISTLIL